MATRRRADAAGRYEANWDSIDAALAHVVHRRQVRHLHPLGRLLGAGLRAGQRQGRDRVCRVVLELADRRTVEDRQRLRTWKFHQRVYGANFPYFDFAPMFRAELYDPDHWADVFERSGAKYVALTSKHHEGFTLWQSAEANQHVGPAVECRRYRTQARRPAAT